MVNVDSNLNKLWRNKPEKAEDCSIYSNIDYMENITEIEDLFAKWKLPIISKKSLEISGIDIGLRELHKYFEKENKERMKLKS